MKISKNILYGNWKIKVNSLKEQKEICSQLLKLELNGFYSNYLPATNKPIILYINNGIFIGCDIYTKKPYDYAKDIPFYKGESKKFNTKKLILNYHETNSNITTNRKDLKILLKRIYNTRGNQVSPL